jgi:hypothetical protein
MLGWAAWATIIATAGIMDHMGFALSYTYGLEISSFGGTTE